MKFSYWTGVRFQATSNANFNSAAGTFEGHVSALRLPTDTYVRSSWWAQMTYASDASSGPSYWWQRADVYFAAQFDDLGVLLRPGPLVTGEPAKRVGVKGMYPMRFSEPEFTPEYAVEWTMPGNGLDLGQARRKGDGTHMPRVAYAVYALDLNGFFGGLAEPAHQLGCNIYGRVLWESDQGP